MPDQRRGGVREFHVGLVIALCLAGLPIFGGILKTSGLSPLLVQLCVFAAFILIGFIWLLFCCCWSAEEEYGSREEEENLIQMV